MLYYFLLNPIIEVLIITLPVLLIVAYVTVAERKILASMQRRLGPNIVGYYGSLQAFADALKLLLKEYISPTQANMILFFLGPVITLVFSLLGYAVIPFGPGLSITDFNLAILYILAVSSLSTYGILLAGWSANSKYAFLGSLRSTAQLISYELILSSAILLVVLLTGSLNLTVNIEAQRVVWFIIPLAPIFIVFFIGSIAETNRAPFDLAEAESELVSGFMTEHAAVIFVFFFLAEYASIALICILVATLFLGGYSADITYLNYLVFNFFNYCSDFLFFIYTLIIIDFTSMWFFDLMHGDIITIDPLINSMSSGRTYSSVYPAISYIDDTFLCSELSTFSDYLIQGLSYGLIFILKSFFMVFVFIWGRASYPRIRFDQLMSFCWTILLPIVIGFIILFPCIIYSFDSITSNFSLLGLFLIKISSKTSKTNFFHFFENKKKVCFSTSVKKTFSMTKNLLANGMPGPSNTDGLDDAINTFNNIKFEFWRDKIWRDLDAGLVSPGLIAKIGNFSLKDLEDPSSSKKGEAGPSKEGEAGPSKDAEAGPSQEEKDKRAEKNRKKREREKRRKAEIKKEKELELEKQIEIEKEIEVSSSSKDKGKGKEIEKEVSSSSKDKGKGKEIEKEVSSSSKGKGKGKEKLTNVNYSSLPTLSFTENKFISHISEILICFALISILVSSLALGLFYFTFLNCHIPSIPSIDMLIPYFTSLNCHIPSIPSIDTLIPNFTFLNCVIPGVPGIDMYVPNVTFVNSATPNVSDIDKLIPDLTLSFPKTFEENA